MEKRSSSSKTSGDKRKKTTRKMSEYGKQLMEKQKVKHAYGMREKQFKRFFGIATKMPGAPGANLLSLLERRLDNTLFRLKFATSREQARQIIVHGHVLVNGRKVFSPSYLVSVGEIISIYPKVLEKKAFVENVINKRLNIGIKVPEWLELDKKSYAGKVLRSPERSDIKMPVEEHLIVELYSKS